MKKSTIDMNCDMTLTSYFADTQPIFIRKNASNNKFGHVKLLFIPIYLIYNIITLYIRIITLYIRNHINLFPIPEFSL